MGRSGTETRPAPTPLHVAEGVPAPELLSQTHVESAGLQVQQLELQLALKWDVGITGNHITLFVFSVSFEERECLACIKSSLFY